MKEDNTLEWWHFLLNAVGFSIATDAIRERIKFDDGVSQAALFVCAVNAAFAIECASKAFIMGNGGDEALVRKIGHKLNTAVGEARKRGLAGVSPDLLELSAVLDNAQVDTKLRYPRNARVLLPEPDEYSVIVSEYVSCVASQLPDIEHAS